jgi:asparagine synthase (glutamine-hydrolysing)
MLFAFADLERRTDDLIDRVAATGVGRLDLLQVGTCWLGAFRSQAAERLDPQLKAAVEGWIEFVGFTAELSPKVLRAARGDFALIASTRDGLLVASGVAGGCRPVYVTFVGGAAVACTHLESLLAVLPTRPKLDVDFLASSALLEACPFPTATPYMGVQRVPSGEAWTLRNGAVRRERIVRPHQASELRASGGDLAAQLREEIVGSVRRALRGRRRVAIATSGGLDSSSLLAITCQLARDGELDALPDAYHIDFDTPSPGDDRPHVCALASHLKVEVRSVIAADTVGFRRLMTLDETPCRFAGHAYWTALGRRVVREGADLLLSGEGGDFVLDGERALLADLAWHGKPIRALRTAVRLRGAMVETARWRVGAYLLRPMAGRWVPDRLRRLRRRRVLRQRYPWAGPRLRQHLSTLEHISRPRPSLDWSPADRYASLVSMPLESFFISRAQAERGGGHLQRDPFLDDDFLRFVATLPPLSLMHGDYRRGLLREAMRGLLPEGLRLRETKAYFEPALWQMVEAAGGFTALEDLADVRMMADMGLVEPRRFREHFDEIRRSPLDVGWPRMWATLAVEAFLRHDAGVRGAA